MGLQLKSEGNLKGKLKLEATIVSKKKKLKIFLLNFAH